MDLVIRIALGLIAGILVFIIGVEVTQEALNERNDDPIRLVWFLISIIVFIAVAFYTNVGSRLRR